MSGVVDRVFAALGRPEPQRPGPWWWRLRCRLSQRLLRLGGWLEPNDQVTAHEVLPDGSYRFFDARRTSR